MGRYDPALRTMRERAAQRRGYVPTCDNCAELRSCTVKRQAVTWRNCEHFRPNNAKLQQEERREPVERGLDKHVFRVKRGRWFKLCFTDLTEEERETVLDNLDRLELMELCCDMAALARRLADRYDAVGWGAGGGGK